VGCSVLGVQASRLPVAVSWEYRGQDARAPRMPAPPGEIARRGVQQSLPAPCCASVIGQGRKNWEIERKADVKKRDRGALAPLSLDDSDGLCARILPASSKTSAKLEVKTDVGRWENNRGRYEHRWLTDLRCIRLQVHYLDRSLVGQDGDVPLSGVSAGAHYRGFVYLTCTSIWRVSLGLSDEFQLPIWRYGLQILSQGIRPAVRIAI